MGVIGVDCGGTSLRVGLVDRRTLEIRESADMATPGSVDQLADVIAEATRPFHGATAMGVAVAGLVDHASGDLVWMPHLGGGTALGSGLAERTGLAVSVDNDANAAALAEATAGAGVGYRTVLVLTVGTGIGGGLVIDGRVERGRAHLGEVGHLPLDPTGPVCSCGRVGCWETLASGRALDAAARRLAAQDPEGGVAAAAGDAPPDGRHLIAAADGGDGPAGAAVGEVAAWFGRGLAGLVAALDPDVIVVGGGVGGVGEMFLAPATEAMQANLSGAEHRRPTPVVAARFGATAGLLGAAMIAIQAAGARDG